MKQTIFLSIYLLFSSYKNKEVLANECVNSITPRIVGGEDADMSVHSYTLSLRYRGIYFCAACAIGERDVIATARCFTNHPQMVPPYLEATVHSGTPSIVELGTMHLIEQVMIHPEFAKYWEDVFIHDIAYVRLKEGSKLEFDENQRKADLPTRDVFGGLNAVLTGWGRIIPNVNAPAERLQMIQMTTLTFQFCETYHGRKLQKEHLCAVHNPGNACAKGDKGNPLVRNNAVIGILSWFSRDSSTSGIPDIFTNVFQERSFIEPLLFRPKGQHMGVSSKPKKIGWLRKFTCTAK